METETMRIYYLSASEIPSKSANSVHVMKMCGALASLGHRVRLYARSGETDGGNPHDRYGVLENFPIKFFKWPRFRVIGSLIYIGRVFLDLLQSPRPDLLYSRYAYLLLPASFLGVDCIYEAHMLPSGPIGRCGEAFLFRRKNFRHLVVISEGLKADYLELFTQRQIGLIVTAHDGADVPVTAGRGYENSNRPSLDIIKVGYVGQLYHGKIMEILLPIAPRFPGVEFHLVGGTDEDLSYWKNRAQIPNIIFHGYVPHCRIGWYYSQFDIVLAPFQRIVRLEEGKGNTVRWMSPLKIFEYMAHAKAIIASDLPVLREVLENNVTALMVSPEDAGAWGDALDRLLKDRELRKSLGEAALKRLTDVYTWRNRVQRVLGVNF